MNIKHLNQRMDEAINLKRLWLEVYLEVYRYVTPNRDDRNLYGDYIRDAKNRTINIYDSTAILAAYQRANELQGLIIPSSRPWGRYEVKPKFINSKKQASNITDIDLANFNNTINDFIDASDLQEAASSAFLDLTIGMGALWIQSPSDENPLMYKSVSSLALYPEFTSENIIDTAWTKHVLLGRQILERYPSYNGAQRGALERDFDQPYFLWVGEIKEKDTYYTYHVLENDRFTILEEEEKPYKRLIIFRDRVRPGEVQGRGIAIDLYPNIKDLNEMVRDRRKSAAYKANPLIFYDTAAGINPYSMKQLGGAFMPLVGGRAPLQAMELPSSQEVLLDIQDARAMIREGFKIDRLSEIDTPPKTATEVSIEENKDQRSSATNIARLISELPKQLHISSAQILDERQLLGNTVKLNDKNLRFNYSSPLLDIKKQSDLVALQQVTQYIQQNLGESMVMTAFNLEKLVPFLYTNFNLPPDLFVPGQAIEQALAQMAQQAQQAQGGAPQPTTTASQPQQLSAPQSLV